jgi:hypothetical protein
MTANTRQTAGINRMRPPVRKRMERGTLSTKSLMSKRAKYLESTEYEARQLIARAKEVMPQGRYNLAIKKLNEALDLRTLDDMDERARIAQTIEHLKSKRGIEAMEMMA